MKWIRSVRGRLVLVSAVVIAVVLTIAGLAFVVLFESYIERRVAQELNGRMIELSGAFDLNDKGMPVLSRGLTDPRYATPYSGAYWHVREGPKILWRSQSLWDADVELPAVSSSEVVKTGGPDSSRVYLLERQIAFGKGQAEKSFILGVALDEAEVQALSSSFGSEIATILAVIGLLLIVGAWLQAIYGLQPLRSMRTQLDLLRRGEREQLAGPFPEEIEDLTQDLNTLFTHQKQMIQRARDRAGSLAHGLKTPMTILYGEARKLELSGERQTAQSIRSQLDLIRAQVDRELSRARAYGSTTGLGLHADVTATAERLVGLMRRMPRGADIDWRIPDAKIQVAMDADDFGEILGNLLDNARKWAKSAVELEVANAGAGRVALSISDDGPGVSAAVSGTMLERGSTDAGNDSERAAESSGLGLSIVRELINAYGGELMLGTGPLGGMRVTLTLPGSVGEAVPLGASAREKEKRGDVTASRP